ncbi:hypothetical protein QTH97_28310 [Variovorax sp. J22R24]|uniref:hypothetical protein n=1 Tax=Variovorax gracilis TaxID=3053502 RepID=UPI0025768103|nr:hypothetical protein [Variovorax sp. J22R24]MDM0108876.1 hypothetical protein [Variovorax sp. J22R24]
MTDSLGNDGTVRCDGAERTRDPVFFKNQGHGGRSEVAGRRVLDALAPASYRIIDADADSPAIPIDNLMALQVSTKRCSPSARPQRRVRQRCCAT